MIGESYQKRRERIGDPEIIDDERIWFRFGHAHLLLKDSERAKEPILSERQEANIVLFANLAQLSKDTLRTSYC